MSQIVPGSAIYRRNIILASDSYKTSHHLQTPPGTTNIYSYAESRGGRFDKVMLFGPQSYILDYLMNPITKDEVDEAESYIVPHGVPFNRPGWDRIVNKHGGFMPVRIKAMKEGTVAPILNAQMTIENLDDELPWTTNYLETSALRAVWYGSTVATLSWHCRQIIMEYLNRTCDDPESEISFKLHDFGARGASSGETAGLGGAAHLVNFMGTDTLEALKVCRLHYNEHCAGFSIPASEHSTITSWGREKEVDAFRNMIAQFGGPEKMFACVSDSYDLDQAVVKYWGTILADEVRKNGGRLVVRPDSGVPANVVLRTVQNIARQFGHTVNQKGYKVLPPYIRVIQGDGITIDSLPVILETLVLNGWSTENVAFGMGGGLLQQVNRDTQKYAFKCSAAVVEGYMRDVYKDPATDSGKRSKKGRFSVKRGDDGQLVTVPYDPAYALDHREYLETVYEAGNLRRFQNFADIRKLALAG